MEKILVVFLMVLYKVLDGFADVYESEFQRGGRLYLTGKAMAYRTLFSVALFLGALAVTRHLIFACAVAVCAQGMGIILFDKRMAGKLQNIKYSREKGREWTLIRESFLLFLSVFLDVLIFSMAKYAVNANMTSIDNAIFVAIFMPTSVINLAANFVIRPFLTKMAIQWEEGRFHDLAGDLRKLMGIILFLTVIALAGAWVLGVPVLGAISNVDLVPYKSGLMMIILGGGFFAVMNLFYYVLVVMKCQKRIFFGYVPVCILSFFLSYGFVKTGGINGGACSYMIEMALLMICFMGQAYMVFFREKKRWEEAHHG